MLAILALLPAVIAGSLALTTLEKRQETNPCAGLGGTTTDNASNFTLEASSDSNSFSLVLAPNGDYDDRTSAALVTEESYPDGSLPGPVFSLDNGTLSPAVSASGQIGIDAPVTAGGGLVFFILYPEDEQPVPAAEYCIQSIGDPAGFNRPSLAVLGSTGNFSLCTNSYSYDEVIYQATEDNGGIYDYDSCTPVQVEVVY